MEYFIDKKTSLELKGIAVIMMVLGHCLGHPEWWVVEPRSFLLTNLAPFFRVYSRISVGVFTFLSGYSCKISDLPEKGMFRFRSLRKILVHFYFHTFIVFFPMAILFGNYVLTLEKLIMNVVGLKDSLILFSWYVPFYVSTILLVVPLVKVILRGEVIPDFLVAVMCGTLIKVVLYFIRDLSFVWYAMCDWSGYYIVYMIGYLVAKHRIFERIIITCSKSRVSLVVVSLIIVPSIMVARRYITGIGIFSFESAYVFLFTLCSAEILKQLDGKTTNWLRTAGKLSIDVWFFHAIFFSQYTKCWTQGLLNRIPSTIIKTLCVLLLSFVISYPVHELIDSLINKISIAISRRINA